MTDKSTDILALLDRAIEKLAVEVSATPPQNLVPGDRVLIPGRLPGPNPQESSPIPGIPGLIQKKEDSTRDPPASAAPDALETPFSPNTPMFSPGTPGRPGIILFFNGLQDAAPGSDRVLPGIKELNLYHPPGDVPPERWFQFIDDSRSFVDSGWAVKAIALGWDPLELFGCDADRPFARIDRLGLVWFLNGCTLVALTAASATYETRRTGARLTLWRKSAANRVMPWELPQHPLGSR
jgi:hypothetical protein